MVLPAALVALGCPPETEPLRHDVIRDFCVQVPERLEQVFRTESEWLSFLSRRDTEGSRPAVDFGQRMIAAHFEGEGSACTGYTVDNVVERLDEVRVQATRHLFTGPCIAVIAYPQVIVSIENRDLPVRFQIRDVETAQLPEGATRACR